MGTQTCTKSTKTEKRQGVWTHHSSFEISKPSRSFSCLNGVSISKGLGGEAFWIFTPWHKKIIITRLHYHRKCWKRACLLGQKWAVLYLISIHRSVLCLGLKPNNYCENKTKNSCKQQCGAKKETRLSRHGDWKTRLGPTRPPQNKNGVFTAFGSRDIEEKLISIN